MRLKHNKKNSFGYTLIEVIVAVAVFLVVATAVYDGYVSLLKMVTSTRLKTAAIALANENLEIIRNLPFESVGLIGGVPAGVLARFATSTRSGADFAVRLSVQDIDDPFDGQIGGSPNDLAANDYKRVEVEITCSSCQNFTPFIASTYVAPKNLENNTGNGALFVQAIDANGQPVTEADVRIILASKNIDILERTNLNGMFQLVNTYPADLSYKISVSKNGFSTDKTYEVGESGVANPVKPLATVQAGRATQLTFAIDRLANINLKTMDRYCGVVSSVPILWRGSKLIGTNPDIFKLDETISTNNSGLASLLAEWDTYTFNPQLPGYALAGSLPLQSLAVAPGSDNQISMVLVPQVGRGLLVSVKDGATGLPVSDAEVRLVGLGIDVLQTTNRGFWAQSDWSGGDGQVLWSTVSSNRFASSSNIDISNPAGEIKLVKSGSADYVSSGWLQSSVFNTGSGATSYYQIGWLPLSQGATTGYGNVRLQLAVSDDPATTTWKFLGPDGTADTFYTATTTTISSALNNHQYIRYRLYLSTLDPLVTPVISDLSLTYGSECLPFGQVFFDSLNSGDYTVTVSKSGHQSVSTPTTVSSTWQSLEIPLLVE